MKKNIAVIGCGHWGKNLVRNFSEIGALAAICDPNDELAQYYADKYNVDNLSFMAVTKNEAIEGVVLAVPAPLHASMAIEAINAGKHVFVEKPLAMNRDEAEKMIAYAKENGVHLMVGHLLQYHPVFANVRRLVDSGELGALSYIYSNRLSFGKVRSEEDVIWSFAPHDVAVILRLMGHVPVEVSSCGGSYLTNGIADTTMSNLRFSDASRAHIFVSWLHPFKEQRLVVVGDKKMAIFNDVAPFGEKLQLYPQNVEFEGATPLLKKEDAEFDEHADTEPLREECGHFLECIQSRNQPLTDAHSGIDVLKVLHACQQSIEQNGVPVSLSN